MIQTQLHEVFSVPSASNPEKRFEVRFNGMMWTCNCEHFNRFRTPCRHILQKQLETKTKGLFDGDVYHPLVDEVRLTRQLLSIWKTMVRGDWLTLNEISEETHAPPASVSAQLRHLRKPRFGSHLIDKRRRGPDIKGLWEYHLTVNENIKMEGVS